MRAQDIQDNSGSLESFYFLFPAFIHSISLPCFGPIMHWMGARGPKTTAEALTELAAGRVPKSAMSSFEE